jgi:hypothetical protein
MRTLRSVAAIVAGYGVLSLTAIGGSILTASLFIPAAWRTAAESDPSIALPAAYLAASLVNAALGAVMAGWLTARIAAFAPFIHAAVLAAIVAVAAIAWAGIMPAGSMAMGYSAGIDVLGVAGVLAGGKLRAAAAAARGPVVA